MKIMNVSFAIDVKNIEHVNALASFMAVLGEHQAADQAAPVLKAPPVKKEKAQTAVASPEPEKEEPATIVPVNKAVVETAITLELLRGIVSGLVKTDSEKREKIKAKLESFGVASVSTLSADDYNAFHTYLNTL